jgi:hypothetical protein
VLIDATIQAYQDGKRATLTLGPESGSYAPFGAPMSFQISLHSVIQEGRIDR